ncbi:MAG: ABC transporter substrate-binding protein [Pseudomonadota bacterium]
MRTWCHFVAALLAGLIAASASASERVLQVVSPWEVASTDPSKNGYIFARMQIAETLLDADDEGRPQPGLATNWDASDDLKTWRFELRDGVTFHDGTPLTAEIAAASLEAALAKPGVLNRMPIDAIAADGNSVVITLSEPFAAVPAFLAHHSTQTLAPASYGAAGEVTDVIGTGPYRITLLEPPQSLEVERFDDYWGPAPEIQGARYLAVSRGETRALMAESGDADLVFTLDPASYPRLERSDRLDVQAMAIPRTIAAKVDAGHPFLDSVDARQALSLAIDRQGIAAASLRFPEAAATQLLPPSVADWHVPDLSPLAHDPDKARALLASLGWSEGPDGILERDGEAFHLTVRTFPDRPELPLIATAMQDQLRQVGIDLDVSVGNSSEIPSGHQDGSLEMALFARNFGLVPDPLGTMLQDFSKDGGDWGAMNWDQPEMVAVLTDLSSTTEAETQAALRGESSAILQRDLPVIPIAWYQHTAAVNKELEGVSIDPLERSYRIAAMSWAK